MARPAQYIGWCAASWIAIKLSVAAGSGYLAVIGPKPLHFQTPATLVRESVVLPPLVMREEEPATLKESQPFPPVPPLPPPVPLAVKPESVLAPVTNEIPASTGTDTNMLTPQMLLRFFSQNPASTNRTGAAVFVPAGFAPAQAAPIPSSSATYSTTP
ncbi:MAG: hypothetical protein HY674_13495 [Chloroflexi bacterium]|nr:hypothetical protein [Chloroflexota bacterium]